MIAFNPNEHRSRCERYLSRFLESRVRFVHAEPLVKSTRDAPWRLDVEVNGAACSYVLRLDSKRSEHEYEVLHAMETVPIPTPRVYGWDPEGEALGVPCFFSDFIAGESLLKHMLAGGRWAEALFIDAACALQAVTWEQIDAACALQAVTWEQVASVAHRFGHGDSAADVLEDAYAYFETNPKPLADAVYARLKSTMLTLPAVRFSNGDLYADNLIVRDRQLAGVIDFEQAGFSDPIYEFLLTFFVCPQLRGCGIEERYCRRMGFDPASLNWYHGLEYFETWTWVLKTGEPFVQYTAENLPAALNRWLDEK